ncbi:MAG TPA: SpaA isopeptide-forming pilin-related protein [Micromonosporaceae bacterium]
MVNETNAQCRASWLVDPGVGNLLDRGRLLAAADLYQAHHFSRQWLWYAPMDTITVNPANQEWTECPLSYNDSGICPANLTLPHHSMQPDFGTAPVTLDVFTYDHRVVSRVCGNYFTPQDTDYTSSPVPSFTVEKFNDRNRNGVRDPGEEPLPGFTFRIERTESTFHDQPTGFVDTVTTGPDGIGRYRLDGEGPGTYSVEEVGQDDWVSTTTDPQYVTVPDGVGDATVDALVFGNAFQAITASAVPISATEGLPYSGTVATFTDPDTSASADEYRASVDWGDGTGPSDGVVTRTGDGSFAVTGTHTYTEEGSATATVTITDVDNAANHATASSPAAIADAPLAANGNPDLLSVNPVADLPVATFTDANPQGSVDDFSATIDWGDDTMSAGDVARPVGGPFTVTGSHTYSRLGPETITVHIADDGGSTATAVSHLIVFAYSGFVIGDGNDAVGTDVTFWGSQWSNDNRLSGGTAPDAFKGFQGSEPAPGCGGTWVSRPGDSSDPPDTVPSYIAVAVSSHVEQSGSDLTGDIQHVVIVRTDPGYAGDPGHHGTGEIVAVLC